MDVDSDSDGNDAGMGFLRFIAQDKDDDISDMLLAQLGSVTEGQRPASCLKSKRNKSAHTLEVTVPEQVAEKRNAQSRMQPPPAAVVTRAAAGSFGNTGIEYVETPQPPKPG